ncbi:MAG: hypothetical protein QM650_07910 [Microlunatus sp.]
MAHQSRSSRISPLAPQGTGSQFREAAEDVQRQLPIRASADTVTLMTELAGGRWERRHTFALSGNG